MRTTWCGFWLLACAGIASAQPARPAAVETTPAEMRSLAPSITATGQVRSRTGADIAAGIGGRLAFVVEPGTRVAKDAVVARVDLEDIRLQRAEQSARVIRGEVALRQAEHEYQRLAASGSAVSRFQLDQSANARDLARADLEIARAALSQTDERVSRAEVRAPFAGVVAERVRQVGEEVARGDAVARMQDTEHLEIRLFLPLRHVRAIAAGTEVKVLDDTGRRSATRVRTVVPVGDARSQSFEALIETPALDPPLAVGRTVRVQLPLESPRNVVAVPRDAVVIRGDGLSVYVVRNPQSSKPKVERVPVRTGVSEGDWVEVTGSLNANDAVVVRGAETLHDGDPVELVGERREWKSGKSGSRALSQS
ncbi:MAG TPA: efflux RND transporter periplasmic adaptor subunit [Nevskiaceae bacterium]|nr:efflux RND transporter periplasmic adaptor subunit [Nevskiaceae bacterium]